MTLGHSLMAEPTHGRNLLGPSVNDVLVLPPREWNMNEV